MPRGDRTGPWGEGPMTGRRMGPCARGMGYGRGFGLGMGYGYGRNYFTKAEELDELKEEAEVMREDLRALDEQIKELEGQK